MILSRHRIVGLKHRRQAPADGRAIVHRHFTIGPLGHDLHRAAVAAGNLHPHQTVAKLFNHRLGEFSDSPLFPGLVGKAVVFVCYRV